jgi:hypothetical protein
VEIRVVFILQTPAFMVTAEGTKMDVILEHYSHNQLTQMRHYPNQHHRTTQWGN